MSEPTIPEAAVEAAAKPAHDVVCRCTLWNEAPGHRAGWSAAARAALAAAEPLMHEGHHAVIHRLRAENARLRGTLTEPDVLAIRHLVNGCSLPLTMEAARERWLRGLYQWHEMLLPAALAPSDEERDRV